MKVIILSGLSGSGKDHTAKLLSGKKVVKYIKRYTTRPKRDGEDAYFHISDKSFNSMMKRGEFIEISKYYVDKDKVEHWRYATKKFFNSEEMLCYTCDIKTMIKYIF